MVFKAYKTRSNESRVDVIEEDFIPFACHIDPHTLITKNGELMQVIKVSGFNFETVLVGKKKLPLRDAIREAIRSAIHTDKYAIWIHTVRKYADLSIGGEFKDTFSADLQQAWKQRHEWDEKYTNELYITVLIQGETLAITDFVGMLKSLNYRAEMKRRRGRIDESLQEINETMQRINAALAPYGAQRLGVMEDDRGIHYSEIMGFLTRLINLTDSDVPLTYTDASWVLHVNEIAFGFNAVEVYHKDFGNYFAAILSIKEYLEVAVDAIDRFLQLPMEFIITETFDFINNDQVKKHFEKQEHYLKLAGDGRLAEVSGLTTLMQNRLGTSVDFGQHQITMMLLSPTLDELDDRVEIISKTFADLGIVFVREDIFMEDCFWAQLPGNFPFIKRMYPVATANIGGYASLYNFPAGKMTNNHWGAAVSVFYTNEKTPYFFNFHYEKNGHTMVLGPFGSGKTILVNFLLAQSRKFNPKIYLLDYNKSSFIFMRAINGNYTDIIRKEGQYRLNINPFLLPDTAQNRHFLTAFMRQLMVKAYEHITPFPCCFMLTQKEHQLAEQIVHHAFSLPAEQRTLNHLIPQFFAEDSPMHLWCGQGSFQGLFNGNQSPEVLFREGLCGLDMTQVIEERTALEPLSNLFLHVITQMLDGTPTMIVMNEAWKILGDPSYAGILGQWLTMLAERNAMVVFCSESYDDVRYGIITKDIIVNTQTHIYLPTPTIQPEDAALLHLTEAELDVVRGLDAKQHHFMIKHHADTVVAELNLGGLPYLLAILSAQPENIALMENSMLGTGPDASQWLPLFRKRMESA